jgi:hypothetical protein
MCEKRMSPRRGKPATVDVGPFRQPLHHSHRSEFETNNLNSTVAQSSDRGVLFCARGEMGRIIPRFRKGLRRSGSVISLAAGVARDPTYSHARSSDAPFPPKLSAVSLSRAAWAIKGLSALNRSRPTWVGLGSLDGRNRSLGHWLPLPSGLQTVNPELGRESAGPGTHP